MCTGLLLAPGGTRGGEDTHPGADAALLGYVPVRSAVARRVVALHLAIAARLLAEKEKRGRGVVGVTRNMWSMLDETL